MDSLMIILSLFLIVLLYIYIKKHKINNDFKFLPGPINLPIIGYLPFLNPKEPYKTLYDLSKKYGKIYEIKLGSITTVVLSDVNLIREAFRRDEFSARAPLYITHGIMGGYGLICAEGDLWKNQRRHSIDWLKSLGMVKFSTTTRNLLEKRIGTGVKEFLDTISINSKKSNKINPMNALHHSLGNILNELVFGLKYSKDDSTWKYLQLLQEEGVKYIGISGVVNFLPILRFLPSNKKIINFLLDGKSKTHAIYDEIIKKCLENLRNKNDSDNVNECILKCYLQTRENHINSGNIKSLEYFSDEQLKHLLADLFGAGVDTTLSTLRWFLMYMAKHSEIQECLKKKLLEYDNTDLLELEILQNIDLLKACVAETQRIRSVVPLGIPHGTVKDTIIDGYIIKKNSMIIPLQWAVHMNENYWKNPENFDPNRFLNDAGIFEIPSQFIPFQTGKRMCLGDELAKQILYIFAGNIIKNYKIYFDEKDNIDFTGECGITLTPLNCNFIFEKIV